METAFAESIRDIGSRFVVIWFCSRKKTVYFLDQAYRRAFRQYVIWMILGGSIKILRIKHTWKVLLITDEWIRPFWDSKDAEWYVYVVKGKRWPLSEINTDNVLVILKCTTNMRCGPECFRLCILLAANVFLLP